MKIFLPTCLTLLLLAMAGCADVTSTFMGQYYLNAAEYAQGRSAFTSKLSENPDDPILNYYMARFELGADNPEAARPFIEKAVRLAPDNADYRFWEGVTWWALMEPDKEKAAYEKALAINPEHLSANLYLGHNELDRGKNAVALDYYARVLRMDPEDPQAMFNTAVALDRLGRSPEMRRAMKQYLDLYPDGPMARLGTDMLNRHGDFSWRNHMLGLRTVTLKSIEFEADSAALTEDSKDSLAVLGSILTIKQDLDLHVVVYAQGNSTLARQRALAIRGYVSGMHPDVSPKRLIPSWFDQPEIIKIDGRSHVKAESVSIFTKVQ
jgi:tetratricopeptide (TPR) repeat protein